MKLTVVQLPHNVTNQLLYDHLLGVQGEYDNPEHYGKSFLISRDKLDSMADEIEDADVAQYAKHLVRQHKCDYFGCNIGDFMSANDIDGDAI